VDSVNYLYNTRHRYSVYNNFTRISLLMWAYYVHVQCSVKSYIKFCFPSSSQPITQVESLKLAFSIIDLLLQSKQDQVRKREREKKHDHQCMFYPLPDSHTPWAGPGHSVAQEKRGEHQSDPSGCRHCIIHPSPWRPTCASW
jgi:hypothetical protein